MVLGGFCEDAEKELVAAQPGVSSDPETLSTRLGSTCPDLDSNGLGVFLWDDITGSAEKAISKAIYLNGAIQNRSDEGWSDMPVPFHLW